MNRREVLQSVASLPLATVVASRSAQGNQPGPAGSGNALEVMRSRRQAWLDRAQALIPTLSQTEQSPLGLVHFVADPSLALRYRLERESASLDERRLKKGDSFILDFGGHRTGHFSFDLIGEGRGVDAPVRLRLTFGEVPTDVAEPLYPYTGQLATGWLPDEVINVDYLPQSVHLPRRYAFRFVKVEVIDTSSTFAVRFQNVRATALTSSGTAPPALRSGDELLDRIDAVGLATLRDCMQTVFEDGPRRDQRLWLGDLRLQALAAYATYGGHDLVKRCLYLFAAFPREDGLLGACVYEKPTPRYGGIHILDYAALFNAALCDYVEASRDTSTGGDLWPVALRQVEVLRQWIDSGGLFVDPKTLWLFIDWNEQLDRTASIQGVLIYAFDRTLRLSRLLGREREVSGLAELVARMRAAAREHLFDRKNGVFVSGPKRQVSWASQAWLTIAGVPASAQQSAEAMRRAITMETAVRPTTPYLYHHVVAGLLSANLRAEAVALIKEYWGGMVSAGADTFWEIYDPEHPLSSPYGDIHINSYCHAWSCTPTYFLRVSELQPGRAR